MRWRILSFIFVLGFLMAGKSKAFDVMEFPNRTDGIIVTSDNIFEIKKQTILYIKSKVGQAEQERIIQLVKEKFPDLKIFSVCGGSFKTFGNSELALAMANDDLTRVVYTTVLSNERGEMYLKPVIEFAISGKDDILRGRSPSLRCNSSTEILRIIQDYTRISSRSSSRAKLTLISNLDAVCIVPLNSVAEFTCYQYSPKRKQFHKIGDWYND